MPNSVINNDTMKGEIVIVFLTFIALVTGQELIANIISVSSNQPCYNIDAQLINSTANRFECSTATIIQMGLAPSDSGQPSISSPLLFRALPTSTDTYNQDFQSFAGDPQTLCSDPSTPACITAIENENLFTVTIEMSSVQVRYQLIETGLTIPWGYFYETRPYAINSQVALDACGIDPYSDMASNPDDSVWAYAKPVNTITINKDNITTTDFPGGASAADIYAQYLLSYFSMSVPGDEHIQPPAECSVPDDPTCNAESTAVPFLETSYQFDSAGELVIDPIYNRWLNGTLGTGQAFGINDLYLSSIGANMNYQHSAEQCIYPIGNFVDQPNGATNSWTTNVCPGNPIPNFKARNGNIYPTYCINGPCAGLQEAFCSLVAGFKYGFTRCLLSKQTAIEYMELSTTPQTSPCNHNILLGTINDDCCQAGTIVQSVFLEKCDNTEFNMVESDWYYCIRQAYLNNVPESFNSEMFHTFEDTIDTLTCGTYMQGISGPPSIPNTLANYDAVMSCPYPMIFHQAFDGGPPCGNLIVHPYCFNPGSPGWASDANGAINDVREFVVPFQNFNLMGNYQVGFCGASSDPPGQNPGTTKQLISPTITTSPCACAGVNGWQDTVIPIGPLCTVYELNNPGTPTYEINITVTSNLGGEPCYMTIGSSVGTEGMVVTSSSCNNTVAAFDITVDNPRGNVLPSLYGYIVICGTVVDDEIGGNIYVDPLYGGDDKSGRTNPYDRLDDLLSGSKGYRTPLPSTFRDMFTTSGTIPSPQDQTACTKDSNGNCAWWYYVPPGELFQYGEQCGANGFMPYGAYSTTSANIMCENAPGTCIPGYDTRFYDARRFDPNATSNLDGYPYKWPVTKTPGFVARTFVDFETRKTNGVPINLPPGWQPMNPSYWINNGYLFSDTSKTGGPVFPSGSIFARIELAIAGELLASATSFAPGELCYTPNNLPPNGIINSCERTPANQLISSCNVMINGGGGTLQVIVHNTGTQVGTYTIKGNCTNGATIDPSFDFSVQPNSYTPVNLAMEFVNINGEEPVCDVSLYLGFSPDVFINGLRYQCYMVKNGYDAPGTVVIGSEQTGTSTINSPPANNAATGPNACDGSTPGWWCFKWLSFGHVFGWLDGLALGIIVVIMIFWVTCFLIHGFGDRTNEASMDQLNRAQHVNEENAKAEEAVRANKEMTEINKKMAQKANERKELLMEASSHHG